mgnify:FL=1
MKATAMTKALAACAALALFAGTALAAAIPSPVGTTLSPRSDNVGSVRSVRSLDQETHDELLDTAADVLELEYGTVQTIESLLGLTVIIEITYV